MEDIKVITHIQNWISSMVIGLNLCPFAAKGFNEKTIRYQVSRAEKTSDLLKDLQTELEILYATPATEVLTTLLIHPQVLHDFFEFNIFLKSANQLLRQKDWQGFVQIVGFHPDFLFQDADSQAAQNYTNRSPYPLLHLLREASVSEVANLAQNLLQIPKNNIQTLETLGTETILERLDACRPQK